MSWRAECVYRPNHRGLPQTCIECDARLQQVEGHPLPCASCLDSERYVIRVTDEPSSFDEVPTVKTRTIQVVRRSYFDSHFPKRFAFFWWTE